MGNVLVLLETPNSIFLMILVVVFVEEKQIIFTKSLRINHEQTSTTTTLFSFISRLNTNTFPLMKSQNKQVSPVLNLSLYWRFPLIEIHLITGWDENLGLEMTIGGHLMCFFIIVSFQSEKALWSFAGIVLQFYVNSGGFLIEEIYIDFFFNWTAHR